MDHPGGHIEYFEFREDNDAVRVYSAHRYLVLIINEFFEVPTPYHILDKQIVRWVLCGTMREVIEEAGLDLYRYWDKTDLIRLGTRTYYFSAIVGNDTKESGPMERFKNEIFVNPQKPIPITKPKQLQSNHRTRASDFESLVGTTPGTSFISDSPNYFNILCNIGSDEEESFDRADTRVDPERITLNQLWDMYCDQKTHHAWVTGTEMRSYWDDRYLYHIDNVIQIHD